MKLQAISPMSSIASKNQRQGLNFDQESKVLLQEMAEKFPKAEILIAKVKMIYPEVPASVTKQVTASALFNPDSFSSAEEQVQFIQTGRQLSQIINDKVYRIKIPLTEEFSECNDETLTKIAKAYWKFSSIYPTELLTTCLSPLYMSMGVDIPRSKDAQDTAVASLRHLLDCLKEHKPN